MSQHPDIAAVLRQMGLTRYESHYALAEALVEEGYLKTGLVIRAFAMVDRKHFLTARCAEDGAYMDSPMRDGKLHQSAPSIYAKALECLELRPGLSFLNIGSGTGYFSALVAQLIGEHAFHVALERHESNVRFATARCRELGLSDVRFLCGNCFCIDVEKSIKFDRIYIGAGAPASARFLYKLLKFDGIVVGPFADDESHQQVLQKVRCRGGKQFAVTKLMAVQFEELKTPGEGGLESPEIDQTPIILQGPVWSASSRHCFPDGFQHMVRMLYWMSGIDNSLPSKLPWELWSKYIITWLPYDAFDSLATEGTSTCGHCRASRPGTQCGRCKLVFYCGRDCQRQHWPKHKHTCASPLAVLENQAEGS